MKGVANAAHFIAAEVPPSAVGEAALRSAKVASSPSTSAVQAKPWSIVQGASDESDLASQNLELLTDFDFGMGEAADCGVARSPWTQNHSNLTPLNTPLPQITYGGLPVEAIMLQGEEDQLRLASRQGFRPSVTAQRELRALGPIGPVIRQKIRSVLRRERGGGGERGRERERERD